MVPPCLSPSIHRNKMAPNPMQSIKNMATRVAWSECEECCLSWVPSAVRVSSVK